MGPFSWKLQSAVLPSDDVWSFTVSNMPTASTVKERDLIKSISVISSSSQQEITLRFIPYSPNRAVRKDELDRYITISFEKFRLYYPVVNTDNRSAGGSLQNSDRSDNGVHQPAPPKESADYIVRLLRSGISLNGVRYHFYGHSNSQLKSRSCFLYASSPEKISQKVELLGNFSMKSVAKKVKRIGLLFSSAQMALALQPDRTRDIADVTKGDYIFTDGCGLISKHLAKRLVQSVDIRFRNNRYTPSVFQIRYRGYKGVVMLEPKLQGQILVEFRESMRKFKGGDDLSFSVVDFAKPYSFGYLNDEVILLLHSLGISEAILLAKQRDYLEFLANAVNDPRIAFRFLSYINELELAEQVLIDGIEPCRPSLKRLVNNEERKLLNKRDQQRSRILIPKSRLLFGICDSRNVLKEGECAIRITMDGDGVPRTIVGTEVLVTRNPCLHPGDLQKFKAVQIPELSHLVDCIVFPTRGRRPSADLMSGGDLDGDKFFVCWDPDLVPPRVAEAAHYQGAKEPLSFKPITDDDRLIYFATYTSTSLGRVKNLFMDWARAKGPMSPECQELNHLFSHCVDGNRIKIPAKLEQPPLSLEGRPPFILDSLHDEARALLENQSSPNVSLDGLSYDMVELLLSRDDIAISEFELVQLTQRWCTRTHEALIDFLHFFDFNQTSNEEKEWVVCQLPTEQHTPSLVTNALLSSSLVSAIEINHFKLDLPRLRWKCIFDSTRDRLSRFQDIASNALGLFHKKLIIIRVDTRLTVAIYIPNIVEKYKECLVNDRVRLLAFPHSQGNEMIYRRAVPTKVDYRLYYDDNGLQLYNRQRRDTWVFINKPGKNDSHYRNIPDRGDRRRTQEATMKLGLNHEFIASIALNKFSDGLAKHIGRVNRNPIMAAEIYVISNRDVRALQVIDSWLNFIDTGEVIPLFEKDEREYKLPSLKDVVWSAEPEYIQRIAKHQEMSILQTMRSFDEYQKLFEWLNLKDQRSLLSQVFRRLLFQSDEATEVTCTPTALKAMLNFLSKAPFLVLELTRIEDWSILPPSLRAILVDHSLEILEAIVLSANTAQDLILQPFKAILGQIPYMLLNSFGAVVQTISLVVRTPELAHELYLECLEPSSSRLLTERPALTRYFVKNVIGMAMEHIDEAHESRATRSDSFQLKLDPKTDLVTSQTRIDAQSTVSISAGDHVRLTAVKTAENSMSTKRYSMDALVEASRPGFVKFRCLHPVPIFLEETSWELRNCGSFVTTKTMHEALVNIVIEQELCCEIYDRLLSLPGVGVRKIEYFYSEREDLNESQNNAVAAALSSSLTCLWGPPGTGKTHTIAVILEKLLQSDDESRILVTAPTHNAVDNVMRKFLANMRSSATYQKGLALRVSTDVRKVSEDLRGYTCDAMFGKDLNENPAGRKKAQKQIQQCRLVFTTCIGAGLGLLRSERFPIVVIDEASQQTETASLVPLAKGCNRAILVGDHVQLRATVHKHAELQGFDVSLFERLYLTASSSTSGPKTTAAGLQTVMLDTQYRMHSSLCSFSSNEFYDGRLQTALPDFTRPLPPSQFPWPQASGEEHSRLVFVPCATKEDLGRKSKSNAGQAQLTRTICSLLLTAPESPPSDMTTGQVDSNPPIPPTIAVLTPYTAQATLLKSLLPSSMTISTIDGFQGREADIIVYVTVLCNVDHKIGFLRDARRLNVALTRAKVGCIVVGDRATLEGAKDEEREGLWRRLVRACVEVRVELSG